MNILEFVQNFKDKKIMNTKVAPNAVQQYITKELEIKKYIPFNEKRKIAEMVVDQNIKVVDGLKKYSNIDAYIGFVMASLVSHTNLECSANPIADYDALAECGLLQIIISEFQESHNEIDILLKMALAEELEDNNTNALIGRFLDAILKKVDGLSGTLNGAIGNLDLENMFADENVAKIIGLLNK